MHPERITSGHTNARRTIWDLVAHGDVGGGGSLYHLSWFDPVHAGAQIGGPTEGSGHYHEKMWEMYLIVSGTCIMSLRQEETSGTRHFVLNVSEGEAPYRLAIPPRTVHRLIATSDVRLLIAATGPQTPEDTFPAELALPPP